MLDRASETFYSIEAPGVLRSNADYIVAINLFDAPKSCDVRISLSGGDFNVDKVVKVHPFSTRMLSFEIPNLKSDVEYYLEAESLENSEIKERNRLFLEKGQQLVFIQCDKQAYKKGDHVDFRVVFLEPNYLKPAFLKKPVNICIKHLDNQVLQISDVKSNKGVCTAQWLIPTEATHGLYEIEVFENNELIASKTFEIIDYKAPKFDVKIRTLKNVLYAQRQLFIDVESTFSDGAPVRGHCKMEVETVGGFFSGVYLEKNMPINGKIQNTIIDLVDDLKIDSTFVEMEYFVDASIMVKVTVTNEDQNEEATSMELVIVKKQEKAGSTKEEDVVKINAEQANGESFQNQADDVTPAIQIEVPQNDVRAGEYLNIAIKCNKPTNYVAYVVTVRGAPIQSEFLKVDNYQQPVNLVIETTFQYVPRAFILAYFVCDGVLYFDEKSFNFIHEFDAKLEITKPDFCEPGAVIPFKIETAPNSLVALMAVDTKSVLLNAENDLQQYEVFRALRFLRSRSVYIKGSGRYPGLNSGLLTLSNAKIDGLKLSEEDFFFDTDHLDLSDDMFVNDIDKFKKNVILTKQEYEQVYGNWFFVDKESDSNGLVEFEAKLPDRPTTWLLTAFAVSAIKGFTMLKEPLKITAQSSNIQSDFETLSITEKTKVQSKITDIVFENYSNVLKQATYKLEIPSNAKKLETIFTINNNLFGFAIAHLSDHANVMYATGHLHMTTVIPNINVLEYLDCLNQLDSELAISIKTRFPEAIQRELADCHEEDGSFSWFGNDPKGSPHITSLVLQAFQRAAKYVEIDSMVIKRGLNFLVSQQLPSGEIAKEVEPFKQPFQENLGVGLTSMVLLAFLINEHIKAEFKDFINKSFDYIVSNIAAVVHVYDLALAFYAMQLAKHPYVCTLKARLFEIAKTDAVKDHKWWPYDASNDIVTNDKLPVNELEITSYVLLGLLETESIETLLPIIKWMLPRNEFPNETMERAMASDAILKMAIKCGAASGIMEVEYKAFTNQGVSGGKVLLTPENSARILMQVLPIDTTKLEVATKHNGTFYGNISCRYEEL